MIALADCNNFYASCERVFNPKLKTPFANARVSKTPKTTLKFFGE